MQHRAALHDSEFTARGTKPGARTYLQQQTLEQLIQTGLVAGLSQVSAGGALGVPGASLVGQLGWVILVTIIYNESDTMHGKNLYHAVEYS